MSSLTQEIKESTKNIHSISDKLVNAKLLVSFTNKELYGKAILLFYYIYAQLELSIENCKDDPTIQPLYSSHLTKLKRADAFSQDLIFYLGKNWEENYSVVKSNKAVREYVEHLKHLEQFKPYLLIPYLFSMYLAIFAGGQMIKKLAIRSMKLPLNQGTAIFEFPEIKDKRGGIFRNTFKEAIDQIPLDSLQRKEVLLEAIQVFKRNNEVVKSHSGTARYLFRYFALIVGIVILLFVLSKRIFLNN